MHHGVNPHFNSQPAATWASYGLLDNWRNVSTQLASAGLKVIFTGHEHAQDAAYLLAPHAQPVPTLCDVETGSLITYPCPYRIAVMDGSSLQIETRRVTEIAADTGELSFQHYALDFYKRTWGTVVLDELPGMFGLSQQQALQYAPLTTDTFVAHNEEDESPSPETKASIDNLLRNMGPLHTLAVSPISNQFMQMFDLYGGPQY